jgi:hypothetical protein
VYNGWHEITWHPLYDEEKTLIGNHIIKRKDIKGYLTPDFYSAYRLWSRIKMYGLPDGTGWLNQPAGAIELIELFDRELALLREKKPTCK